MSSTDESEPYDENTLYRMAEAAATEEGVPHRWREDAVAEYVARAWRAGQQAKNRKNIRGYQCCMGHGALRHFMLREQRQESLTLPFCSKEAKRVTLDKTIKLRDGERVSMVETIPDEEAAQPDARMLRREREEAVRRAMEALPPLDREVVQRVLVEGQTQVEAADTLGLSRQKVQRILDSARACLQDHLSEYRDAFNGMRFGKK